MEVTAGVSVRISLDPESLPYVVTLWRSFVVGSILGEFCLNFVQLEELLFGLLDLRGVGDGSGSHHVEGGVLTHLVLLHPPTGAPHQSSGVAVLVFFR